MQVLPPYTQTRSPFATFVWVLIWLGLAVGAGVGYGYMAAVGPFYFLPVMTAGIAAALLLLVLMLPKPRTIPVQTIYTLYFCTIAFHILIPEYFALFLPGLPWMSPMRITAITLTLLIGYLISSRQDFQSDVTLIVSRYWLIFFGGVANVLIGALVLPLMGGQIAILPSALFDVMIYIAFVLGGAYLYWKVGRKALYHFTLIMGVAVVVLLAIGTVERVLEMVPWRPLIPAGYGGDDAFLISELVSSKYRNGAYRVQSVFSNPLLFAEYLALVAPILLGAFFWTKSNNLKIALIPVFIYTVYAALVFPNARLSLVALVAGICSMISLYLLHKRRHSGSRDLFASVGLLSIPAIAVVLSSLLLFSRRVQIMVFGGGEHASSNESRATQWDNAFNAFPQSPVFGFGYSQATRVAGVPGRLGESTVLDSWYINVLMDSGVLGAALYLSAFVAATYRAFQLSVLMKGRDAALMMALASMMIAKMTINSVLSLTHNQVLLFFAYGIVIGASLRYQDQLKDFRWFPGRDEKAATI
jgi:hypothetical protein